nr:protein FAR1-RELATED SEQUENCE 5-like [Ipomoea batatas]
MHAVTMKSNAFKVVWYALIVNFTGRMSNLQKAYHMDLFHLWSIENEELINMGVQCKKWLSTKRKENDPYVFIGSLVTTLCHGHGLDGKLRKEKVIASMTPITLVDLIQAKLTRVGEGGEDDVEVTVEEEAQPEPHYTVPPHVPNVHDWESMRALQYHFHEEQMTLLRAHGDTLARHGEELMRHGEEIGRQTEAIDRKGSVIDELQAQSMYHFHPPSQGVNMDSASRACDEGYSTDIGVEDSACNLEISPVMTKYWLPICANSLKPHSTTRKGKDGVVLLKDVVCVNMDSASGACDEGYSTDIGVEDSACNLEISPVMTKYWLPICANRLKPHSTTRKGRDGVVLLKHVVCSREEFK